MVVSFVLPAAQAGVTGILAKVNLAFAGGAVPAWWDVINDGSCRKIQFSANAVFIPTANCKNWSANSGVTGANYALGTLGANTSSLQVGVVVATPRNLVADQEYFDANLDLLFNQTVDFGSCAGCSVPACIAIQDIEVGIPATTILTQPANGTESNFVTWQGGGGSPLLPGGTCLAATPARKATWGAVKALYR